MQPHPTHPGTVVFYDADKDEITDEADAATLPDSMKFEETDEGLVPIVRVVLFTREDRQIIASYGPNGELLRTVSGSVEE